MTRKRPRPAPPVCTLNLTGFPIVMAPVILVLLTILMLWPTPHHGIGVDLPFAHHPVAMQRANREDAMIVMILRDGKVYLRSDPAAPGRLPAMIRQYLSAGAERKVYLKVDRYARYGVVLGVLAEIRSAGVEKIAFLALSYPSPQGPSP